MYLYNLTLQRATGITHAVHGNFSGSKVQEVLISRGKSLELLRIDSNTGKLHTILTMEIFGCIRALMSFRLTGGTKGEGLRFPFSFLRKGNLDLRQHRISLVSVVKAKQLRNQ